MNSRVDLHVHSRFSTEAPEWIFRRLRFPHSLSEPDEVYLALKAAGMDFVTLTDHDTIEGGLTLAGRPDVFLSEEITAYFPGDPCRIHLLVWDITENQHHAIQSLRRNILELQSYLITENLAHAVAHPLRSYDAGFSPAHFEKLLLLFQHFETVNGLYDGLYTEFCEAILEHLTPEVMEGLAARHGIAPAGPPPWRRFRVGGSNDHAGLEIGSAWTETPAAASPGAFCRLVSQGACQAGGRSGSPLAVSHAVYKTAAALIDRQLGAPHSPTISLLHRSLLRFLAGENPADLSLADKFEIAYDAFRSGQFFDLAKSGNSPLYRELAGFLTRNEFKGRVRALMRTEPRRERRAFLVANLIGDQMIFRALESVLTKIRAGRILECLEQAGSLIALALALAPYAYAFQSQAASPARLRKFAHSALGFVPPAVDSDRRAWFTDTLYDVNGVSMTIRKLAAEALRDQRDLTIVTCSREAPLPGLLIQNFAPVGEFDLPEYEMQRLALPPVLRILEFVQANRFSEIIISTPGPVGLCGLLAGRMLGLDTVSIYHTDFPQYVNILTDDSFLETLAWQFMRWFYDQTGLVYVNSEHYRKMWIDRGIDPDKIATLPRGLDARLFHPSRRDPGFFSQAGETANDSGDAGAPVILYAGRVSKEKDLDLLAAAERELRRRGHCFRLAIVGDGPYQQILRQLLPAAVFTGYLQGEELARAYASADIFAFPSTTDTYGNVVAEALASGLPCVVSDAGGPRDLVRHGETGFITPALDARAFTEAIETLLTHPELRQSMAAAARSSVADRDWSVAFRRFWNQDSAPLA
ncbi:MAG TPA: glycosyltransferase [Verrucomicrobiales bacterium]|nr:glycosyltransferase [Verrucomicrobiales bacterium]